MDETQKNDEAKNTPARWILELGIADKGELGWRKEGEYIERKYRGDDCKSAPESGFGSPYNKNSFNILWSNTELLKPAIFTRTPKPLCKPRFYERGPKDNSPAAAASQVMQRALTNSLESYDFSETINAVVLDALLPGRGVVWIRYEPTLEESEQETEKEVVGEDGLTTIEIETETVEELVYEEVYCEYVNWRDFRYGEARRWADVPWVARQHKMTRRELKEKFGEKGEKCPLGLKAETNKEKTQDEQEHFLDRAEVWEIWDKTTKTVVFVCPQMKTDFLDKQDDPLNLTGFFPCPRPVQFIETTNTLTPVPEFSQYATLAKDLDKVTSRIINLVDAIRARGVYDSELSEMSKLFSAGDADMIPVENGAKFAETGFDKAIWMLPIKDYADVLNQLYQYRNALVQSIYEITGISDIMRGSSSDIETARAQEIKSAFGTLRLQDRQKAVQRFARDIIRMKAEIIGEQFTIETLRMMTGLEYPTQEEKQQAQIMMAYAQQSPEMQHDPQIEQMRELLEKPTWEEIKGILETDILREFSIEIETDSTLHSEMVDDKRDITELLQGITEFMIGIGPMVASGVVPMDTAKALLMAAVRRFKLGTEVEDALQLIGKQEEGPAQPQQPSPEVQQAQIEAQRDQDKQRFEIDKLNLERQISQERHQQAMEQIRAQSDAELVKQQAQMQDKMITGVN